MTFVRECFHTPGARSDKCSEPARRTSIATGPSAMPSFDFERMSLRDLVELRDLVARELKGRFERSLALIFTDVVSLQALDPVSTSAKKAR